MRYGEKAGVADEDGVSVLIEGDARYVRVDLCLPSITTQFVFKSAIMRAHPICKCTTVSSSRSCDSLEDVLPTGVGGQEAPPTNLLPSREDGDAATTPAAAAAAAAVDGGVAEEDAAAVDTDDAAGIGNRPNLLGEKVGALTSAFA